MSRWLIASLVAVLAMTGVISGCGGGGDDSTAEAMTKTQYLAKANAVCAKVEKRQLALIGDFTAEPGRKSEEKLILIAAVPPLDTAVRELAELTPPENMSEEAQAFLAAFEKGIKEAEENPGSLLNRDTDPFAESRKLASELGLKNCGGA